MLTNKATLISKLKYFTDLAICLAILSIYTDLKILMARIFFEIQASNERPILSLVKPFLKNFTPTNNHFTKSSNEKADKHLSMIDQLLKNYVYERVRWSQANSAMVGAQNKSLRPDHFEWSLEANLGRSAVIQSHSVSIS